MRVGEYELEAELGRGGMGVVHRARHVRLGRCVALKRLVKLGGKRSQRFEAEAQALARLKHPNIVAIHEVGLDDEGKPFIAMAMIEGRPLAHVLRGGPLPPRRAAEIARDLADALDHAHRAGVLHRDIKPENVLLTDAGVPILTDFGLARELSDTRERLTRTGQLIGTPVYMAPEQAASDQSLIGPETDVYGLGATLYTMLTGEPPIVAETLMAQIAAVVERPPTPPGVDRDLDAITLTCLAKAPKDRYPDAAELALDLARYLEGTPISASGVRPPRRSPRVVGAVVVAAVLLVAALAAAVPWGTRPPTIPERPSLPAPTPATDPPQAARAAERLAALGRKTDAVTWRAGARDWLKEFPNHGRAPELRSAYLRRGLGAPRRFRVTGEKRPYTIHFLDPWRLLGLRDLDSRFDVFHLRDGRHRESYGALSNETASWSIYAPERRIVLQRMSRFSLVRWSFVGHRARRLDPQRYRAALESEWAVSADGRRLAVLHVFGPPQSNRIDVMDTASPRARPLELDLRPGWKRDIAFFGDLLVAWNEGEVVSYDLRRAKPRPIKIPRAEVLVAGSSAGVGVVQDGRGRLALVRLATGHRLSELPGVPPSPDPRLGATATFTADGGRFFLRVRGPEPTWEVWDVDPPRRVLRVRCGLPPEEPQGLKSLRLSPDGARLAAVSWNDDYNLIVRWEIAPSDE